MKQSKRFLVPSLLFIALVVAAVGSLGAPLITSVATTYSVPLDAAQWTLTSTLFAGAMATPVLGRLGAGLHRRKVILGILITVFSGSILTVLPLPFAWLLVGRTAQGIGLSLTALTMAVARDELSSKTASSTIALLSVASTVGIGIGYPLAGLLTDLGGLRLAYGLGALMTTLALVTAWRVLPESCSQNPSRVDPVGAGMLIFGLLALLLAISDSRLWIMRTFPGAVLLILALVLLIFWAGHERQASTPLFDLTVLRHPAVLGANLMMFLGGVGMYLLLALATRYVQTPSSAGYGFGATVFVSGLILVPFSILGFAGGRITPWLRTRMSFPLILTGSSAVVLIAIVWFAFNRFALWEIFVIMALLGLGVGIFSASMPGLILTVAPAGETAAAMSFNQVVRSIGFSVGSAVSGLALSFYTKTPELFPANQGYTAAAVFGAVFMFIAMSACLVLKYNRMDMVPGN